MRSRAINIYVTCPNWQSNGLSVWTCWHPDIWTQGTGTEIMAAILSGDALSICSCMSAMQVSCAGAMILFCWLPFCIYEMYYCLCVQHVMLLLQLDYSKLVKFHRACGANKDWLLEAIQNTLFLTSGTSLDPSEVIDRDPVSIEYCSFVQGKQTVPFINN